MQGAVSFQANFPFQCTSEGDVRLKKTLANEDRNLVELDTTQMKAIGASKAPAYGVEDIIERRCRISVDVADLKKAIKELFGREFGGLNLAPR